MKWVEEKIRDLAHNIKTRPCRYNESCLCDILKIIDVAESYHPNIVSALKIIQKEINILVNEDIEHRISISELLLEVADSLHSKDKCVSEENK